MANEPVYSPRAKATLKRLGILAVINFIVFTAVAIHLGGAAMSGHIVDGQYFLSMGGPKPRFMEVTQTVWLYSYYHGISLFITNFTPLLLWFIFRASGDITFRNTSNY